MRLLRSEISGFFHFHQPCVVEHASLPDGLVAVIGDNGAGKTSTVLDAPIACLYGPGARKAFPSRDGTLADYATSQAAYIETLWDMGGVQLRARVNVDAHRRKTEAVLEEVGTGVINRDGLIDSFREAVDARFPSLRSLLASAYAAQNKRGGFGELSQPDRIALFRELADLAHLEAKAQTAKRCALLADTFVEQLRVKIDTLRRDATPEKQREIEGTLDDMTRQIEVHVRTKTMADARIADLERQRPALVDAAEQYAQALARTSEATAAVQQADADIVRLREQIDAMRPQLEKTVATIETRHTDALKGWTQRRAAAVRAHEDHLQDRRDRITNNQGLLTDAEQIRAAAQWVRDATTQLTTARQTDSDARRDSQNVRDQLRKLEARSAEIATATTALESARRRAAMLTTVKFGDDCAVDPVCPLVTDAAAARDSIGQLEQTVHDASDVAADVQRVDGLMRKLVDREREAQRTITTLERDLAVRTPKANLVVHLEHAEKKIAEYRTDIADAEQRHQAVLATFDTERQQIDDQRRSELQDAQTDFDRQVIATRERMTALVAAHETAQKRLSEAERASASTRTAKSALDRLDLELRVSVREQSDADTALARLETARDALLGSLRDMTARIADAAETERRRARVEDEGLAWQTLAKALGRDGLQRLEIDAAGPVVSDLANTLLAVGYGTRFSVQLVTQVATADGKDTKEKFTIEVLDNLHAGEPRDIGDLSGGERVVVEEAIRAALSCYVNMRSRQPSRTIWRDETLGALDPENAPKYVAMLRKMLEISGAAQILYITHNLAAAALADAQVRVKDGTATIALPPYVSP